MEIPIWVISSESRSRKKIYVIIEHGVQIVPVDALLLLLFVTLASKHSSCHFKMVL